MSKRTATHNLDRDNWQEEEEPEELGVFKKASEDQMRGRLIKKAKRRCDIQQEQVKPVFNNFTAFNTQPVSSPKFSFGLSNKIPQFSSLKSTNKQEETKDVVKSLIGVDIKQDKKHIDEKSPESKSKFSFSFTSSKAINENKTNEVESNKDNVGKTIAGTAINSSLYYGKLKALNVDVLKWIQQHVEKNPYISLIPVFDDYTKFLIELKEKHKREGNKISEKTIVETTSETTDSSRHTENLMFNKTSVSTGSNYSFGLNTQPLNSLTYPAASKTTTTEETKTQERDASKKLSLGEEKEKASEVTSIFSFGNSGSQSLSSNFSFGVKDQPSFSLNYSKTIKTENSVPNTEKTKSEAGEPRDDVPAVIVDEVMEEGSIYNKKVKLFYKKDGNYVEKGVGTLFLKPAGKKTQLIVRASTNLGNILLNIVLNTSIPSQRLGKNNVLIMCIPNPPLDPKSENKTPVSMLIRTKTSQEADELLQKIEEHKK